MSGLFRTCYQLFPFSVLSGLSVPPPTTGRAPPPLVGGALNNPQPWLPKGLQSCLPRLSMAILPQPAHVREEEVGQGGKDGGWSSGGTWRHSLVSLGLSKPQGHRRRSCPLPLLVSNLLFHEDSPLPAPHKHPIPQSQLLPAASPGVSLISPSACWGRLGFHAAAPWIEWPEPHPA